MNHLKNFTSGMLTLFVLLTLCACEEPVNPDNFSDFFPIQNQHEWRYQRWMSHETDNPLAQIFDTLKLRVDGDTIIEGKQYAKIIQQNGAIDKIVRNEGAKYFARNHELYLGFSHEYLFLDADKNVGYSWSYVKDAGMSKTEYVITAKHVTETILGKIYKNVIVVKVNYYLQGDNGKFEPWITIIHYYAAGVGEIYNYYPGPASMVYGDLSAFIIPENN